MRNPLYNLFLGLGGVFGLIAGFMAYLITLNEWIHHYPIKKNPRMMALEMALIAFIFFFLLSLVGGYLITKIV